MRCRFALILCVVVAGPVLATEPDAASLERLRTAAEAGKTEAQLELGILYEYGFRKPDHLVPALSWYLRAAESGDAEAMRRRDALTAKLKPSEVDEAKRLAQANAAPPTASTSAETPAGDTAPISSPTPTP